MSIAASKLSQRRRDQARLFQETQSFLDQHHNTKRIHDWEHRTSKQIKQREVDAITQKLLQEDNEELQRRKQELSSLYNGEMSRWKTTLQSSLEVTQEEKMEAIRARAYKLKAKREAERQEFVKQCYERQWRDSCDELRAFDSKVILDRIVKDREATIENNRIIEKEQAKPQNDADKMSLIMKDESGEQSQRRQSNLNFKMALDHQVEVKRSQEESATRQRQHEEQEDLQRLAVLEHRAQESAKEEAERNRRRGMDMLHETRLRAKDKEDREERQRAERCILLQHALDAEQRRIQAERAKREVGKDAASDYVKCRRMEAILEENEHENINRIREAEKNRISKMNDDKMQAEAEARRQWMEEVDITRQEQIRMKRLEAQALRREADQEAADIKLSVLRAEAAERSSADKAQARRMETMLANRATIETRAKERKREEQEKYLIQSQIQNDDRVYQRRMEEQKRLGVGDLI